MAPAPILSNEVRELISGMLKYEPAERPTMGAVCRNAWLAIVHDGCPQAQPVAAALLENMSALHVR